jgi:hypothetical protein
METFIQELTKTLFQKSTLFLTIKLKPLRSLVLESILVEITRLKYARLDKLMISTSLIRMLKSSMVKTTPIFNITLTIILRFLMIPPMECSTLLQLKAILSITTTDILRTLFTNLTPNKLMLVVLI